MPHAKTIRRRQQLVEAAIRVISREGLERATTRRIAAEAGAPLGILHHAFPNKDALVDAVFRQWMNELDSYVDGLVTPGCGIEVGVRKLLLGFLDYFEADLEMAAAQYELLLWARRAATAPALGVYAYEGFVDVIHAALRRAAPGPTEPASFREAAWLLINSLDGVALQYLSNGDVDAARRQLERFAHFIVQECLR